MDNLRTVQFAKGDPTWQLAIAKKLKQSAEERAPGLQTKGPEEWVRVALLAGIELNIDLATRTFNVSPATKPVLEMLVLEYLVVGVKGGAND